MRTSKTIGLNFIIPQRGDIQNLSFTMAHVFRKGTPVSRQNSRRGYVWRILERRQRVRCRLGIVEQHRRNAVGTDDLRLRGKRSQQSLAKSNLVIGEKGRTG